MASPAPRPAGHLGQGPLGRPFPSPCEADEAGQLLPDDGVAGAPARAGQIEQLDEREDLVGCVGERDRCGRAGPQVEETPLGSGRRESSHRASGADPRAFERQCRLGDRPPLVGAADEVRILDDGLVEEHLVEGVCPVISRKGRIVTPGWSSRRANQEIPACLAASRSVRARSMPQSEPIAIELQTF